MLVECHPAGGHFEIVGGSGLVVLRCHWPFDSDSDEWIDIENIYLAASYLRAVNDAMTSGSGLVHGIAGGLMRITALDDGFFLEFSRPQNGWSANSLRLHVRRPVEDLLLAGGARPPRQADDGQPEPGRVTAG